MIESCSPFLFSLALLQTVQIYYSLGFAVLPEQVSMTKKKNYNNKIKKVLNTGPQAHVFFLHPLKSFSFKGKSQAWYSQCRQLLGASPAWQLLPEPSEEGSLKPRFSENAQISAEVHKNLPELSV